MAEPDFLAVADSYQLGLLETEQPHPDTARLSAWARDDPARAIRALQAVDRHALDRLGERCDSLSALAAEIGDARNRGDRIFLCGCGATGRLSISLEMFARSGLLPGAGPEDVVGFMAGGDAALIRSVERFEDHPAYGERQLRELGFSGGDLLIASTEGGETPFVIGATEAAAAISRRPPFFLYANPDEQLRRHVDRSRRVLDSPSIRKLNLAVGPMALAGSTRMQASTVLMAAIGFALKHHDAPERLRDDYAHWKSWVTEEVDASVLEPFFDAEASTYEAGDFVLYQPGPYAITVLTDTTERAPTFSLAPFERDRSGETPSLCFLHLPGTSTAAAAWNVLLQREPRPLEWGDLRHLTGAEALLRFDFSDAGRRKRERRCQPAVNHPFSLTRSPSHLQLDFRGRHASVPIPSTIDFLGENLALKLLLNLHSTLIMGRLGRYEGNLMTYVSANNFKLIDRATRYTQLLLEQNHGWKPAYETVARQLLRERERVAPGEPIVLRTVQALLAQHRSSPPEAGSPSPTDLPR